MKVMKNMLTLTWPRAMFRSECPHLVKNGSTAKLNEIAGLSANGGMRSNERSTMAINWLVNTHCMILVHLEKVSGERVTTLSIIKSPYALQLKDVICDRGRTIPNRKNSSNALL